VAPAPAVALPSMRLLHAMRAVTLAVAASRIVLVPVASSGGQIGGRTPIMVSV
jgi:hypothetical protein